jgi:hypothetical protein
LRHVSVGSAIKLSAVTGHASLGNAIVVAAGVPGCLSVLFVGVRGGRRTMAVLDWHEIRACPAWMT